MVMDVCLFVRENDQDAIVNHKLMLVKIVLPSAAGLFPNDKCVQVFFLTM